MSMPSDVTPDITAAVDAFAVPPTTGASRAKEHLTAEQFGLAAAAAIAFLGVAILGPALARIGKPKPLSRRVEDKARDVRERAGAIAEHAKQSGAEAGARTRRAAAHAQKRARKQARRLGGGTIWR